MSKTLGFEEPVVKLREKIDELKEIASSADVDMSDEIETLETRLQQLESKLYSNMEPWDRVQVARHPNRPTTLDYVQELFTDFIELHGDRYYGDDEAIVGELLYLKGNLLQSLVINVGKLRKKISAVTLECLIQKGIEKHYV